MSGSIYGSIFRISTFGESHGAAIGGVVDGFPPNIEIDLAFIQSELDRRKPGQSKIVTQRKEDDEVRFLSGIFEGKSTGTPIAFYIENTNAKSSDYEHLKENFRPSHADFTYQEKYGHRDYRGGGRSSARETATRVVAGALAKLYLKQAGIKITAFVDQVGTVKVPGNVQPDFSVIEENPVRCAHAETAIVMEQLISATRKKGDTVGGSVFCIATGLPAGLGEPVFDKLHAELGKAMLSINAVKGFEYGSGFKGIEMYGSEHNDLFESDGTTKTNHSGGIQGGISNGMPVYFRTAFKPVATIMQKQESINQAGEKIELEGKGRHDPCVVPRAVPIVEAMTAIVLLDFYLRWKAYQ
ncbi:MAG: Chorismate synthase [Crocinitomicaceae bacterium]|jgi:chorismate synthase|nr:Chorismate synthase [Crocinitomicaceae bacterium]